MAPNQSKTLTVKSLFYLIYLVVLTLAFGCTSAMQKQSSGDSTEAVSTNGSDGSKLQTSQLITSGYINLSANNPTLAKMYFVRALEQKPDSVDAYIGLGEVDFKLGEYENAYQSYAKASSLDPKNVHALIGKAQSLRQQNKFNAAIQEINAAMSVSPNDIKVLTELAIIYDLLGKESLSAPIYEEILAKTPDQAASNNNLGLSFLVQKHYDKAIIAFQRALSLDNKDERIKNNLATAYILYGDEQAGINLFKETVGEPAAYNNLGYLYMTEGRLDDAEHALHKAMDLNPKYYEKAQANLDRIKLLRKEARQ